MIFVTGDTHVDWMTRLNSHSFPEDNAIAIYEQIIRIS